MANTGSCSTVLHSTLLESIGAGGGAHRSARSQVQSIVLWCAKTSILHAGSLSSCARTKRTTAAALASAVACRHVDSAACMFQCHTAKSSTVSFYALVNTRVDAHSASPYPSCTPPGLRATDKDLYCFSGSCTKFTDSCSARQILLASSTRMSRECKGVPRYSFLIGRLTVNPGPAGSCSTMHALAPNLANHLFTCCSSPLAPSIYPGCP
eukprot:COSAG05_NODE_1645_length_4351_cov_17.986595_7_plen_210_part_00